MVGRFIAIARPAGPFSRAWIDDLAAQIVREQGLQAVFDHERLLVLADEAANAVAVAPNPGVVFGTLFCRDRSTPATPDRTIQVLHAESDQLPHAFLRSWWGGYVALFVDERRANVHVLRDPSGGASCYQSDNQGVTFFYNDVSLPLSLGLIDTVLDAGQIAHHLAFPDLRLAATGVERVTEVLAGTEAIVGLDGRSVSRCAWTPWSFAAPDQQLGDREQAVELLRAETRSCAQSWASRSRSALVELSGGLDSSIVAACLRGQTEKVACVTLVTPDPSADERRYAQMVAQRIGAELATVDLRVEAADLNQSAGTLSPRPGRGVLSNVVDEALIQRSERLGVDAFFSGAGGDNVFCYLGTAAPASDVFKTMGLGRHFMGAVGDLATLHRCTFWTAGALAIRKAWRRPRPWLDQRRFLLPGAAPALPHHHPWLEAPHNALPGKREHVAALMRIQSALDGKRRVRLAPVRYPLLSQPLVELCLRIPSWMWISGGRNRSVARDAFAGDLPPEILNRRTKGDFTGFCGAIFERNRSTIAELLLGGWLAGAGILDVAAIEAYLAAPGPARDDGFHRLLEIASVEVWARSWLATRRA